MQALQVSCEQVRVYGDLAEEVRFRPELLDDIFQGRIEPRTQRCHTDPTPRAMSEIRVGDYAGKVSPKILKKFLGPVSAALSLQVRYDAHPEGS